MPAAMRSTRILISQQFMEDQETFTSLILPPAIHIPDAPPPSDLAYLQAAAIFQYLRTDKPLKHQLMHYGKKTDKLSLPESGDKTTTQRALQLAFSTLKYQDLLEEMMTDSRFLTSEHIPSDLLPLAMVMLCNFQERKFLPCQRLAKEGEKPQREVRDLENKLHNCKTKLAASLARSRVKHGLQSVSRILSEPVRSKQHRARLLPLYAWVNTLRSSVEEVCKELELSGVSEVDNIADVSECTFSRDPLCRDTLIFSRKLHAQLKHSRLTATHKLIIQDRSLCVSVSALCPLLFEKADVLVAGSFSALTVAHVAIMAAACSGSVLVCGADHTSSQLEDMHELLKEMDIKNVRVLSGAFFSLGERDATIERLKVIMVLPQCSTSGLSDPVDTIHCENGDWDLLQDLSRGTVSQSSLHKLTTQQARLLAYALTFPQVETVLYCTRSVYKEENEQLVNRVLEKTHAPSKLLPFRLKGPIFPDDTTKASIFFRLESSQVTNGCFVARLSRQADPTKVETVQEVLARAAAKGLLDGLFPEQPKEKKGKSKKNPEGDSEQGKDQSEEEVKGEGEEEKGGQRKRKKRRKRKIKQSKTVPKHHSTSHKKKTHYRKRTVKNKARKIPRLTLTLISSTKPFTNVFSAAGKTESPTASAKKQPSPAIRPATKTPTTASKPGGPVRSYMEVMAAMEALQSEDVLISPQACSSLSSDSGMSLKQTSTTTSPHHAQSK
ncbi:putative methyltransferase NSUN7 [Dunckerocampus dactyliophorus]|uniref:putative methyltransferase NSUN7 n=1 Tax=Dunckerocampus dactyliophorus TaxID=161453 RepID=UPI002405EB14|nr:putative methyltransferase NSUN7 [Dunckerocampus dactyliophorus]